MSEQRDTPSASRGIPGPNATVVAPGEARRTRLGLLLGLGLGLVVAGQVAAQTAPKVDFERDVLPLLREHCTECHGASKQKGDLRLDRRSSATKPFYRRIIPGSSANSMVYLRLSPNPYGTQMPPTAELPGKDIATIRAWIDQGAEWPDSLANEVDLPPPNPKAVAMVDALSRGDLYSFLKTAEAEPALLNERGPEGSTPFMYAVLYTDTETLRGLLRLGADPNRRNDFQATALMWAARDLAKTRLLVRHGADVNAQSESRRTPLMCAARRPGNASVVTFLLDHGADPNPNPKPAAESSPLIEALTAGDEEIVRLLLARGADAKAVGGMGLSMAVVNECRDTFKTLSAQITDTNVYTEALSLTAVLGDLEAVRLMVDRGASVDAVDPFGRTPLMYAAVSDLIPVEVVKLLAERGANVNARSGHVQSGDTGLTVLDIAKQNGDTPVVRWLEQAGAKAGSEPQVSPPPPRRRDSLHQAVEDSMPLLQRMDVGFTEKAGCTSCHNNNLQTMAVGLARERGIPVDAASAASQVRLNVEELRSGRDQLRLGYYASTVGDMFSDFILGYQMVALHALECPPSVDTDMVAMFLLARQQPNGEWKYPRADNRPPLCLDYIAQTALAMRALQLYPPKTLQADCDRAVRRAGRWIASAEPGNNDDRAWRVTGLAWEGRHPTAIRKAVQELLATQRSDGGWSDLPSTSSTAYATGLSLFALRTAGLPASDPAYQRGVRYLLSTQMEDGSWYTKTRALGFQPHFEAGFPHGYDQWISAAASSWATIALTLALPEGGPLTAAR